MESAPLLDYAGRPRGPRWRAFTTADRRVTRDLRYPADPPTVEEIIAVMRAAGDDPDGVRPRGVIVVLWRAGVRISQALALAESDLDRSRGAVLVHSGKGVKRREVGMDRWGWDHLDLGLTIGAALPVGGCSACCATRPAAVRVRRLGSALSRAAARAAEVRRRFAPHLAPARARGRDVARGRAAGGHSAAARPRRSRDRICPGSTTPRSSTPPRRARPMVPATTSLRVTR